LFERGSCKVGPSTSRVKTPYIGDIVNYPFVSGH